MLRSALRREADALPMTLRASDVERAWSERARVRRKQRWTVAAMAAVVIALGGVALATALRPSGPGRLVHWPGGPPVIRKRLGRSIDGAGWRSCGFRSLPTHGRDGGSSAGDDGRLRVRIHRRLCWLDEGRQPGSPVRPDGDAWEGGLRRGVWRLAWDGTMDQRAILAAASVSGNQARRSAGHRLADAVARRMGRAGSCGTSAPGLDSISAPVDGLPRPTLGGCGRAGEESGLNQAASSRPSHFAALERRHGGRG